MSSEPAALERDAEFAADIAREERRRAKLERVSNFRTALTEHLM